ncbi:MAG: DNA-3-methyladenine glycosylase [Gammaproteobacteria bacterium RIFCSPHIGHO2_12_FULL_37_14]|nr:MAG: DNA-3-methyladenine glycosylase [Gammaproteobacteria bacterium RIFCSPHIGHO2_12_FULL_37_14]
MHDNKQRCAWVNDDPIYIHYHDNEWGVAIDDDRLLFEFLILEGAQAGLNWLTILKRRENYRLAFDHFDAEKMADYNEKKYHELLTNTGIIRNRLKIQSVITNAKAYLSILEKYDSFSDYIWQFVDGRPIKNRWKTEKQVPTNTTVSDKLSKDLKARGFTFVGSTICYAFMQAVGMVNDHLMDCYTQISHSPRG